MIGRQIDRYRLVEEIGSGGMAVVYKGVDTALDREVAVKIMHPHLAGKDESRRRFSREARAVARLRHPYILEIYDFSGDEAKESFIVTEYVRGRTLRTFSDEVGFLLPEIAALAAEQLAEALEHAHAAGVVHRDLKPENVMVREDGVLKLMDFGIARLLESPERMTMTGAMVGSPLHMPPEIIEGREADARSDLFALGTILYWMVTGQMAFQGKNTTQTLRRILEGQYDDARVACPACSDGLAAVITRCLQKEPAARYASATELRLALRAGLDELGIGPVETELRAFFRDPKVYAAALRTRLVERLTADGERALAERRPAAAIRCFDRVLALDEQNERVRALLTRLQRRNERIRLMKRGVYAGMGFGVIALIGGGYLLARPSAPADAARDPTVPGPPAPSRPAIETTPPGTGTEPAPAAEASPTVTPTTAPTVATTPTTEPTGATTPTAVEGSGKTELRPGREPKEPRGSVERPGRETPASPSIAPAAPVGPPRPVRVSWHPQGGDVRLWIDGQPRETGATPFWDGELPVGTHFVVVQNPACCEDEKRTLVVEPGTGAVEELKIALPPKPAWLRVESELPGVDVGVIVDGESKGFLSGHREGRIPIVLAEGGRRTYRKRVDVVFTIPGHGQQRHELELAAGQERPLRVRR